MTEHRPPRLFRLKPFPTKKKGLNRVFIGVFFMTFALVNLMMVDQEGWIALMFALFFGLSGFRHLTIGSNLRRIPERDRALKLGQNFLYKVIDQTDYAKLDLNEIKALWLNEERTTLSLMTQRGVEEIDRLDFQKEDEWDEFVHLLERTITATLWRSDRDQWRAVQEKSDSMRAQSRSSLRVTKAISWALMIGLFLSIIHIEERIVHIIELGSPTLFYLKFGAILPTLPLSEEWERLCTSPWLLFNLIQLAQCLMALYYLGRPLERVLGGSRLWIIYATSILLGGIGHTIWGEHLLIGPGAGSFALMGALMVLIKHPNNDRLSINNPKEILKKMLWVFLIHLLFLGTASLDLREELLFWLIGFTSGVLLTIVFMSSTQVHQLSRLIQAVSVAFIGFFLLGISTHIYQVYARSPEAQTENLLTQASTSLPVTIALGHQCSLQIDCSEHSAQTLYDRFKTLKESHPLSPSTLKERETSIIHQIWTRFLIQFGSLEALYTQLENGALLAPKDFYGPMLLSLLQLDQEYKTSFFKKSLFAQMEFEFKKERVHWTLSPDLLSYREDHTPDPSSASVNQSRLSSEGLQVWVTLSSGQKIEELISFTFPPSLFKEPKMIESTFKAFKNIRGMHAEIIGAHYIKNSNITERARFKVLRWFPKSEVSALFNKLRKI